MIFNNEVAWMGTEVEFLQISIYDANVLYIIVEKSQNE